MHLRCSLRRQMSSFFILVIRRWHFSQSTRRILAAASEERKENGGKEGPGKCEGSSFIYYKFRGGILRLLIIQHIFLEKTQASFINNRLICRSPRKKTGSLSCRVFLKTAERGRMVAAFFHETSGTTDDLTSLTTLFATSMKWHDESMVYHRKKIDSGRITIEEGKWNKDVSLKLNFGEDI